MNLMSKKTFDRILHLILIVDIKESIYISFGQCPIGLHFFLLTLKSLYIFATGLRLYTPKITLLVLMISSYIKTGLRLYTPKIVHLV